MAELGAPNLVGLGIGAVLLLLVFRTLWRQEESWTGLIAAARDDAAEARKDAAAARADAAIARDAEALCRQRLDEAFRRIAALETRLRGES